MLNALKVGGTFFVASMLCGTQQESEYAIL
jgi:hypothetical protein